MSFTYTDKLSDSRSKVRFYLQDTVVNEGPKPGDENFSDEEIDGLIAVEGDWQRAVAAGFEILASAWARYPNFSADGLQVNRSDISRSYANQAAAWRKLYGSTASTSKAGSRAVTRIDGYSNDVNSHEV